MRFISAMLIASSVWLAVEVRAAEPANDDANDPNVNPSWNAAASGGANDEAPVEVRRLFERLAAAAATKDVDQLLPFFADDVFLTTQDGEHVTTLRGKEAVRDYFVGLTKGPNRLVIRLEMTPTVDNWSVLDEKTVGIASGECSGRLLLRSGKYYLVTARWNATLARRNGAWQITSLQFSINPLHNAVLSTAETKWQRAVYKTGIVCLILGFSSALILMISINRRRERIRYMRAVAASQSAEYSAD